MRLLDVEDCVEGYNVYRLYDVSHSCGRGKGSWEMWAVAL